MPLASTSVRSSTVLTKDNGIPASKFERDPENYTVEQLRRWLKCRGLKQSGKREELLGRVRDCIKSGDHHTLDSSIDDGKWFTAKAIKASNELKGNCKLVSVPLIPTGGWHTFPSQNVPGTKAKRENPHRVSDAKYQNKRKQSAAPVIDYDPRPLEYRRVSPKQINRQVSALSDVSRYSDCLSMWERQLNFTYKNYDLSERSCLNKKVKIVYNNLTPATVIEIPGTQGQSACEKWFVERWCRLTASKCLPAYKVGKLVAESQPKAASEAFKFISQNIWGIDSEPFQSKMLYGLECEPRAVLKY